MNTLSRLLWLLFVAVFMTASGGALAGRDDSPGNSPEDRGSGKGGDREALSSDFLPIPPTKGKGDGQYFDLKGRKIDTVLNANVRLALELLDGDGNTVAVLNQHLGITKDNYQEAVITVFIGTDEDGDGSCLQEGPTSLCVLETGGSHDLEVNPDGILHAAWAMALRVESEELLGSGVCWSDFDSVAVAPQLDDDGNMTSVIFEIEGGEEAMPSIAEDDGTMVGFGAPWLGFNNIDCGDDTVCEVIPIMMGLWAD